jgi:hypothetical protein
MEAPYDISAQAKRGLCRSERIAVALWLVSATLAANTPAFAQDHAAEHGAHEAPTAEQQQGGHADHDEAMSAMRGLYGPYSMMREASGTGWQPDSTAMPMKHQRRGEWDLMTMAFANAVSADAENGVRGDDDRFVQTMGMAMASRAAANGTLGLRGMVSLDPALVGKDGYPLLFQTGETADGRAPLIDRQHPHDLFMELSASYSREIGPGRSVFFYGGLPGEPALGPVTYLHRFSGMDNPEAPLGHHWFDSTHVTFGVVTAGVVLRNVKLEASAFNGREPDEDRYDIETGPLDSWSVRASWNPTEHWSGQISFGRLETPEQLEPDVDIDRTTASVTYGRPVGQGHWQATFAAGRNAKRPGLDTQAYLLESAWRMPRDTTVFARAERVEKDELFSDGSPLEGQVFPVRKLGLGAVHDFRTRGGKVGVGLVYNMHFIPNTLDPIYGDDPDSWLVFARWILQ